MILQTENNQLLLPILPNTMNKKISYGLLGLALTGAANAADGLYSVGEEPDAPLPLSWNAGVNVTYDDNVLASGVTEDESFSLNPYLGVSMTSISPQTMVEVYGRLGLIYYLDEPVGMTDDTNSQSRLNLRVRHNISERLGITSTNMVSYELEPNYSFGLASSRQNEEHLYWSTDNYLSYRWTERMSTRTGIFLNETTYDDTSSLDRSTIGGYHEFRYELQPLTILTAQYRYSSVEGGGVASDAENHYLTVGMDRRFSPNTVGSIKVGAQMRDVDNGDSTTTPFLQGSIRTIVNEQFSVNGFVRYSLEDNDTVFGLTEFDERETLRLGLEGVYKISPKLAAFGGVNYIKTNYSDARLAIAPYTPSSFTMDEDLINANIGLRLQLNDAWSCSLTYDYTDSSADNPARDYDRQRVTLGVDCQF